MSKVYFTVEEANELLATIRPRLERVMKLNEDINAISQINLEPLEESLENELLMINANKEFHLQSVEFFSLMEELVKMGCIVKDLEKGLVDFYHRLDDEDVYLCWKLDEKEITAWHRLDTGYEDRKPIAILQRGYEEKLRRLR